LVSNEEVLEKSVLDYYLKTQSLISSEVTPEIEEALPNASKNDQLLAQDCLDKIVKNANLFITKKDTSYKLLAKRYERILNSIILYYGKVGHPLYRWENYI